MPGIGIGEQIDGGTSGGSGSGGGISPSILTTTGDMIVASGPSTPARLAAGVAGTVLTGQGSGVQPTFGVTPGQQLAIAQYAPGILATYALTTGMAALDTTNLTLAFTVPASGNVLIELDIWGFLSGLSTSDLITFGVLDHTTHAQIGNSDGGMSLQVTATGLTVASINTKFKPRFYLTGQTPGAKQVDFAASCAATGPQVYAQAATGAASAAVAYPAIMRALAA